MPKDPDSPADPSLVKSAARVFEVLELLGKVRRPLSASEIGSVLEYPKSSANVLLKSLVQLGYLSFDLDSMQYFPSLRVTALGEWIPSALYGTGSAAAMLEEVHDRTHETVTLSMRSGLSMRFIRVLPGKFFIALKMEEGYLAPLFGTAVGAAHLSARPAAEIARLAESAIQEARTREARKTIDTALKEAEAARQRGYAVAYGRVFADTGAVAMPLPPAADGTVLVIGVGGLHDRIRRNERMIARAMRNAITQHVAQPTLR